MYNNEETFGSLIKRLRIENDLGSRELSSMLKKGASYISQIENGRNKKPDFLMAWEILKHLKVDEEERENILIKYEFLSPSGLTQVQKELIGLVERPMVGRVNFKKAIDEDDDLYLHEKITDINNMLIAIKDFNPTESKPIIENIHEKLINDVNKITSDRMMQIIDESDDLATTLSIGRRVRVELKKRGISFIIRDKSENEEGE
ncbi:helix-turn-helix domain-containing protein [Sutcliffiella horikoshii]|uniref:Helix-turn-helix transcriptional regulator n=1 Tax=Sutcliffiella horikoshii TaxID=79883 RepID=A0A5D4TFB4_9BACI|nr:helix-turn-helix transcriptional regulator [Sutcliffiella horikoshii]TYS74500.1 helix-turn-helix transcriptional regulator [Sutcliffiella horikoshii]